MLYNSVYLHDASEGNGNITYDESRVNCKKNILILKRVQNYFVSEMGLFKLVSYISLFLKYLKNILI